MSAPDAWWSRPATVLLRETASSEHGLTSADAAARLELHGPNEIKRRPRTSTARLLLAQIQSPLVLLLVFAAVISAAVGEWIDAAVVAVIVVASAGIGFWREFDAGRALERLQSRLTLQSQVIRDGKSLLVPAASVVPGDVILLSAGSMVPADGVVLDADDCFVTQAALTGETFPVEKTPEPSPAEASLPERTNCVFLGSSVGSGTARVLVIHTGGATVYGGIARRLAARAPETEFNRGLRHFGYLLTRLMVVMVVAVFAINVLLHRPPVETLLFSIALAVGLTPELLPAILSVNLARSAAVMAGSGVLVRRLEAIENLGSMDVLCTDKTGTITRGVVACDDALDPQGRASPEVLALAAINAALQTGLANPLDAAILARAKPDLRNVIKLGEVPYDFARRRLSVIVDRDGRAQLVTKGAFDQVLEACTRIEGDHSLDESGRAGLRARYEEMGHAGLRVLGVATREIESKSAYRRDEEVGLEFRGFLVFSDPPKEGVDRVIADLCALGVSLKIVSGDSRLVAWHVAEQVGMHPRNLVTGSDLHGLHDEALGRVAVTTDVFAEVDPSQKERIVLALKKAGHVVGYLGDGINDAPALHAADVGVSVDQAADVAREAADFVLLERDLDVLRSGILEGRRTFANTLKYVLTTESANLGNMLSMAAASLFLPFLPLLAGQILLNNFLSDVPGAALAGDAVDPELIERPHRWDMVFVRRFMLAFGALSSVFDAITFGALLYVFHAPPAIFRTAWFVESLATELVIALVVRTRRPLFRSPPGRGLLWSTLAVGVVTVVIPYLPAARVLGFVPLSPWIMAMLAAITIAYVAAAESAKAMFYRVASAGPVDRGRNRLIGPSGRAPRSTNAPPAMPPSITPRPITP